LRPVKIANYLDSKNDRIDKFIAKKQKLIELLEEQRQGIINEAITKGINSNAKMKPSNSDWLGNVPKHWEVKKLRFVGNCQNGMNKDGEFFGSGFPFMSYSDVYKNEALPSTLSGLAESTVADRKSYSVLEGDVFFTRTSETIEEIGFASTCTQSIDNATFSGFLIRFRPRPNILFPEFSKYYFRSNLIRKSFINNMNLITRASLSQDLVKNLPVLIPPISEQQEIVNYIQSETKRIDTAISRIEKEIEKVKELKQSLIAEVVTGKIKVA
jgi:type I restriction enzyme S subunit